MRADVLDRMNAYVTAQAPVDPFRTLAGVQSAADEIRSLYLNTRDDRLALKSIDRTAGHISNVCHAVVQMDWQKQWESFPWWQWRQKNAFYNNRDQWKKNYWDQRIAEAYADVARHLQEGRQ